MYATGGYRQNRIRWSNPRPPVIVESNSRTDRIVICSRNIFGKQLEKMRHDQNILRRRCATCKRASRLKSARLKRNKPRGIHGAERGRCSGAAALDSTRMVFWALPLLRALRNCPEVVRSNAFKGHINYFRCNPTGVLSQSGAIADPESFICVRGPQGLSIQPTLVGVRLSIRGELSESNKYQDGKAGAAPRRGRSERLKMKFHQTRSSGPIFGDPPGIKCAVPSAIDRRASRYL
ncbi:hypothetical protein DFH09DRAFT_1073040 [Mycena vulgaris]|nr:hypothetical protein DFH09DRAFT_1073040 [Mycena vulgaris]